MDAADDPATQRHVGDLLYLGLAIDREQRHAQLESVGDLPLFLDRIAVGDAIGGGARGEHRVRSEEHTSALQSPCNLVCRLLLEKNNTTNVMATLIIENIQRDLAGFSICVE